MLIRIHGREKRIHGTWTEDLELVHNLASLVLDIHAWLIIANVPKRLSHDFVHVK